MKLQAGGLQLYQKETPTQMFSYELLQSLRTFIFFIALLYFCFRKKALKMLNFWNCLSLKESLLAPFSGTCALSSRKYVSEQATSILHLSKKLQSFWVHSSLFALEKQPKNQRVSFSLK